MSTIDPHSIPRTFWASTSRADTWTVQLLNRRDVYKRDLLNVTGGSLDWNVFRKVIGGGTLALADDPRDVPDIDWLSDRFRIVYTVKAGGLTVDVPMGVYLPVRATPTRKAEGRTWSVPLLDKTTVLEQELVPWPYAVPAGALVTQYVGWILDAVNERRYTIQPSPETLNTAMAWPAGTSRLTIVNDLLRAINYYPLYTDGDGVFRGDPYQLPDDRPAVWDFGGVDTVTSPEVQDDYDMHAIPNRFVCVGQESEDTPALVGVAENVDDGPYSYNARGRWITETDTGVEATSKAVITELAARRLTDSSRPAIRQTVEHLPLPLTVNDAARGPDGHHMAVVEQSVTLQPMTLASTVLRRFGTW